MNNKKKLPISVCILVKNEEENLINSLPPLSIFEEILVYDSGSTDQSIEICQNYGAKLFEVNGTDSQKVGKNYSLKPLCHGYFGWMLMRF